MNKSIVKWAGGKRRDLKHIIPNIPKGKRLVEPFCGGFSLSLNLSNDSYWLNDLNKDLIELLEHIKSDTKSFIDEAKYLFIRDNNTKSIYLDLRSEFNEAKSGCRKSALFLYLNRHCFNGLCRYNKKGIFNVPFGDIKTPYFPEKEILFFSSMCSKKDVLLTNLSFELVFDMLVEGDIVYCDPPYLPLTDTANFTSYEKNGFYFHNHEKLAECCKKAKVPVLISNHDLEATRILYKTASKIKNYESRRSISCKGLGRKPVKDLLALYNI